MSRYDIALGKPPAKGIPTRGKELWVNNDSIWFKNVRAMVKLGRKIDAIGLFREKTGAGLKESKDVIDKIEMAIQNRKGQ